MVHLKEVALLGDRFPTGDYYPFNLDLFRRTPRLVFSSPVSFFVGENGTGKSTLLEAVARKCQIHIWKGIERTRSVKNPHEENLFLYVDAKWSDGAVPGSFFSSQIFHNFAQLLDEWEADNPGQIDYFGGRSLVTQSHGQSLMSFFNARYKIRGLYLLDEPETALSPRSQLRLLRLLSDLGGKGEAQFIIATHSPILLACPGAVLYSFDRVPVTRIRYEETEHYQLYRRFMENPSSYAAGRDSASDD
jgi:predicted ATPase